MGVPIGTGLPGCGLLGSSYDTWPEPNGEGAGRGDNALGPVGEYILGDDKALLAESETDQNECICLRAVGEEGALRRVFSTSTGGVSGRRVCIVEKGVIGFDSAR